MAEHPDSVLEQKRDRTRAFIAIFLLFVLLLEIVVGLALPLFITLFADSPITDRLTGPFEKIFSLIFGPTVALVGSATGFYFGSRTGERSGLGQSPNLPPTNSTR
jgi:hypothetical protein